MPWSRPSSSRRLPAPDAPLGEATDARAWPADGLPRRRWTGAMKSGKRIPVVLILLVLTAATAGACRITVWFRHGSEEPLRVWASDQEQQGKVVEIPLKQGSLYSLSMVIEVTDCTTIRFDLKISGEKWNNEIYPLPLQPMNKIVWREGGMKLVAEGIFRAAQEGTYDITGRYNDDKTDERTMVLRFTVHPLSAL